MISYEFPPERVKAIRIAFGESQVEFARRLGVHENMVYRWERGESRPNWGRVLKALLDAEREAERA